MKLKLEIKNLHLKHEKVTDECSNAYVTIKELENALKERDQAIHDLENSKRNAAETAKRLNIQINANRKCHEEEKIRLINEHRIEVKAWKKDLGRANSNHIKLEKKLALIEASELEQPRTDLEPTSGTHTNWKEPSMIVSQEEMCSMCTNVIPNYLPDYFMGETINPACHQCKGYDTENDPFASFPDSGMPLSLLSHWSPPHALPTLSLSSILSLRAHYALLPDPGESYETAEEVFKELKRIWDEERKALRDECHQS